MAKRNHMKIVNDKIYEYYLNDNDLMDGLKNDLIKGSLRLNSRNYKEAYVTHPKRDSDIFIYDKDINRSLFDDIVIIKVHKKLKWKVIDESLYAPYKDKKDFKNLNFLTIEMLLKISPNIFNENLKWTVNLSDLESSQDFNENCHEWYKYFQRTGKVVGIYTKMNSRHCVGYLKLPDNNDNVKSLKYIKFSPVDIRYPRLAVPVESCPTDFLKRPLDYNEVKFIAKIENWNEDEQYPTGVISNCLKNLPIIEQETIRILVENGFPTVEFDEKLLNSIPKITMTEDDLKYRRDYRNECVVSVDPKTARDLDDALHIKRLCEKSNNGKTLWEVGIHIADVTYYVRPDSEVDIEARHRTTTVYMVDRAVPMLPRELCENLCSLNPGTDKLAYSVVFKITDNCEILETWIGRTIIRTACKLSYEDAQNVIDNPTKSDWKNEDFNEVFPPFTSDNVASSILNLHNLAVKMRINRFHSGSLWINQPKLGFMLNSSRDSPVGYNIYKLGPSNHMIEEWMLRANMSIAEFLHKHSPGKAFLRRHESPTIQAINGLNKQFTQIGWKHLCIEKGTTEEFQDLMQLFPISDSNYHVMMNICSKVMQLALYFCLNDESGGMIGCHHFALNVPLYTHFTSPIRRYPDMIVHRQLTEILMKIESEKKNQGDKIQGKLEWMAPTALSKHCTATALDHIADICNKKRKDAKAADESSITLFYSLFVQKCGPFNENGIVVGILDKAFDVFLSHCGFTKRVYLDQIDKNKSVYLKNKGRLTIHWNRDTRCTNQAHSIPVTILTLLSCIDITVSATNVNNSAPILKLVIPNPGCSECQKFIESNQLKDISSLQSEMNCVDEDRLFNILDDI